MSLIQYVSKNASSKPRKQRLPNISREARQHRLVRAASARRLPWGADVEQSGRGARVRFGARGARGWRLLLGDRVFRLGAVVVVLWVLM